MAESVKGLNKLDKALSKLPVNVGKRVLMRSARRAIAPVRKAIKGRAPVGSVTRTVKGGSVTITPTFLKSRVKSKARIDRRKGSVRARAGVFRVPYAGAVEYGTSKMAARPFIRPAWESMKGRVKETFIKELSTGIEQEAMKLKRGA